MDTVTAFAPRRSDVHATVGVGVAPDPQKALAVAAVYRLSEEGRKASLLVGGDGRAVQQRTVDVPVSRLHLVSVDVNGVARLKLRPCYQRDGDQRVVRTDDDPTYDVPPTLDDLFRDAARNYELERAHDAERRAAQQQRQDAYHERRAVIAQAFLDDATRRALVHPAPSPTRCYISLEDGRRLLFDAAADIGVAHDVPAEAHRRFRADLRTRRDRNLQDRGAQLAQHDEKKRILADFIAQHGTPDQQVRQEAGVLPMKEAIEAFTDHAFAPVAGRACYVRDGADLLQTQVQRIPEYAHAVVMPGELIVVSTDVPHMSAAQWAVVNEYRALMPDATVALRQHKISWKRDPRITLPAVFSVAVTQRVEPFTLRREYAVSGM